jgi:hypothetical protein
MISDYGRTPQCEFTYTNKLNVLVDKPLSTCNEISKMPIAVKSARAFAYCYSAVRESRLVFTTVPKALPTLARWLL